MPENLLSSKFHKMAEKMFHKILVFGALFLFEVHIQQRSCLTGETLTGVLLEERN